MTRRHNTRPYHADDIVLMWQELHAAHAAARLPPEDRYPGFTCKDGTIINRERHSLYDERIGLGIQLRLFLALEALKGRAITSGVRACKDARALFFSKRYYPRENIVQLGSMGGGSPVKAAATLHKKMLAPERLQHLCNFLNEVYGESYRTVSNAHRMTPALLLTPYLGEDAILEFNNLLHSGRRSRFDLVKDALILEPKRYYQSSARLVTEKAIVDRLRRLHACRPIQCIVAPGAPTAVEAFAWRLKDVLPAELHKRKSPPRDIFLLPCGPGIAPAGFRGMAYLVHHMTAMLGEATAVDPVPDMSERELQSAIGALREQLGKRAAIFIFFGHDAFGGPLPRMQEAIIDAPLETLLAHLCRPAIGTYDTPFDCRHFESTSFVVIGTAEIEGLSEYKQPTLDLPQIDAKDYPAVLEEMQFSHGGEMVDAIRNRNNPGSESQICLFEQIRRIETLQRAAGATVADSQFAYLTQRVGLARLSTQFFEVLSAAGRPLDLALTLFTVFAIGGIRRLTLLRCMIHWDSVFPQLTLQPWPGTTEQWGKHFDDWLACFAPIIRSGPDQQWNEIDPRLHPFEYTGDERRSESDVLPPFVYTADPLFNPSSQRTIWLEQSIDVVSADIRNAIIAQVQKAQPALAAGIHRILANEALRQHTMILRHTPPADRLTIRSQRRGLQAVYHALLSLPHGLSADSSDPETSPAVNLDLGLPRNHLRRFKYVYDGLLTSLLRDDGGSRAGAGRIDDRIHLEIAKFADDLLFRHHDGNGGSGQPVTPAMVGSHYRRLATAAVRAGPHASWTDARERLEQILERDHDPQAAREVLENVVLQMDVTEYGPDDERTDARFADLADKWSISFDEFKHDRWQLDGTPAIEFPKVAHLGALTERYVDALRAAPGPAISAVSSLFFIFGIMRADAEEARLQLGPADTAGERLRLSLLLKYFSALLIARQLMWDGYGDEDYPMPYFAAEGLRNLCRVGLEIIRQLQNRQQEYRAGQDDLAGLASCVTSHVRKSLDQYTQVFHHSESERAHMLILESRFARIAYRGAGARVGSPGRRWDGGLVDRRRCALALQFLNEAEKCLLNSFVTDGLRIRLLSERCSTLRYLAAHLMREAHPDNAVLPDRSLLDRADMAVRLGLLDVCQFKNIMECLEQSETVWLTAARKAKWSQTASHHAAELKKLSGRHRVLCDKLKPAGA